MCIECVVQGADWNPPDIDTVGYFFRRNLIRLYRDISIQLHDMWAPPLRVHLEFDSVSITLQYLGCAHESRQQEQRREEEGKRLIAWRLKQLWYEAPKVSKSEDDLDREEEHPENEL